MMRYRVLFCVVLLFAFSGCGKDKFETTPKITFSKVNTTELRAGQILQFTISFTDAQGDISDSIFVQEVVPECQASNFKQPYKVPEFPSTSNQKGDIVVTFGYNADPYPNIAPQCQKDETAIFRFALRDKAGNVSDTVSSPPIKIIYQ